MKFLIVLLTFLPFETWSQSRTGEAKTQTACSPAITGTVTTMTINCTGMSKERAEDMVRLMNRILSKQIDPKEVYKQLDQIQASLSGIGDAVNPLAKASSSDLALINDSERLALSCSKFLQNWNVDFTKRQMAAVSTTQPTPASTRPATPVDWHEITIDVDRKWAAEFNATLANKISSTASLVLPQLATKNKLPQFRIRQLESPTAKRLSEYSNIVASVTIVFDNYNDPDVVAKPDPALLAKLKSLRQECMKFQQDWQADYNKTAGVNTATRSANPYNILDMKNSFDKERSGEFEKTVAPALLAWRTKVLSRDPTLDTHVDYKNVTSALDASRVCSDVMNTGWPTGQK
jgi:hypothetical protein